MEKHRRWRRPQLGADQCRRSEPESLGIDQTDLIASLVVITGPIASGKSTVAQHLATELRQAGRSVAMVDVDDVVEMVGGFTSITETSFRQAQEVHGQMVASWLSHGIDVIAHGPFFDTAEQDALLAEIPTRITPQWLVLSASYEVALERVSADPSRGLSSDPAILRLAHDRAETLLPTLPPSRWTYDTAITACDQIVSEVASSLLGSAR